MATKLAPVKWGAPQRVVDATYALLHAQWPLEALECLTHDQYVLLQFVYVKQLARTRDTAWAMVEDESGPVYARLEKVVLGPGADLRFGAVPDTWQTFEQFAFGSPWRTPDTSLVVFRDLSPGSVMYRAQSGPPGPGPAVAMNAAALMAHYVQACGHARHHKTRGAGSGSGPGPGPTGPRGPFIDITAFVRHKLPASELAKYLLDGVANAIRFTQLFLEDAGVPCGGDSLVTVPAVTLTATALTGLIDVHGPVLISNQRYYSSLETLREWVHVQRPGGYECSAAATGTASYARHAGVIVGWRRLNDGYLDDDMDAVDATSIVFLVQNPWREKQFYVCDITYLQYCDTLLTTVEPSAATCGLM